MHNLKVKKRRKIINISRKNPLSKEELIKEIEKHIKKDEPKRALAHLKELKEII